MATATILIKGNSSAIREELVNSGIVTPGQLLQRNSSNQVARHATSGGNQERLVALENDLVGDDIDTNYAASKRVQCRNCVPGDVMWMLLADGENATTGESYLESNGDGDLKVHTPIADSSSASNTLYYNAVVGVALSTLDLSDSSGADPSSRRIKVKII